MLPNGGAVRSVYLDKDTGILAGIRSLSSSSSIRRLLVECGTIENATIQEVSNEVQSCEQILPHDSRLDFVDAPVSGGPNGAKDGTLAFMVCHLLPVSRS